MTPKRISLLLAAVLLVMMVTAFGGTVLAEERPVNINTANKEELMTLKYVGEAIAIRILIYRVEHRFVMPEEIMNVKGIGKKIFEANKRRIIVSG